MITKTRRSQTGSTGRKPLTECRPNADENVRQLSFSFCSHRCSFWKIKRRLIQHLGANSLLSFASDSTILSYGGSGRRARPTDLVGNGLQVLGSSVTPDPELIRQPEDGVFGWSSFDSLYVPTVSPMPFCCQRVICRRIWPRLSATTSASERDSMSMDDRPCSISVPSKVLSSSDGACEYFRGGQIAALSRWQASDETIQHKQVISTNSTIYIQPYVFYVVSPVGARRTQPFDPTAADSGTVSTSCNQSTKDNTAMSV